MWSKFKKIEKVIALKGWVVKMRPKDNPGQNDPQT